jgi:Ran GTPase-activating protein (RanGAP) involved in mRNA processing and transport
MAEMAIPYFVEAIEKCSTKQSVVSQIKKKEVFLLADEVSSLDLSGELRMQYEVPNEMEEENDIYNMFGSTWVSHFDYCSASLLVDACVNRNEMLSLDKASGPLSSSTYSSDNPLSASSDTIGLSDSFERERGLEALKLSNNQIDVQGARLLLKLIPTIRKLDLSSNELGDEGAITLFDAAVSSTSLRTLILSSNQLTVACVPSLVALLGQSTPLRSLHLDHNSLGLEGVTMIVKALAGNTTLEKLGLRANKIGDEGLKCISDFLMQQHHNASRWPYAKCCPLHTLLIGYNGITIEGVKSLTALISSAKIRKLFIDGNRIDALGARVLLQAVQQGKYLVSLSMVDTFSAYERLLDETVCARVRSFYLFYLFFSIFLWSVSLFFFSHQLDHYGGVYQRIYFKAVFPGAPGDWWSGSL